MSIDNIPASQQPMAFTFGKFNVTSQVFYSTPKSFSLVNLRPILPGHVLVCPIRNVSRFSELDDDEVSDLFKAVKLVSRAIEKYYKADALNFAIQDGPLAGQSIDHVHCHIIPRKLNDLENVDDIYDLLNRNDIVGAHRRMYEENISGLKGVDFESRIDRTPEDMADEARRLRDYIQTHFT